MDLTIKDHACKKAGITFEQFCYLLSLKNRISEEDFAFLEENRYILIENGKIKLGGKGFNAVVETCRQSTIVHTDIEALQELGKQMAELFPKGKKPGTNLYWRGNSALVVKKLNGFLKRYGMVSAETILKATDAYIKSFGYDTTLMRLLPYFIEKDNESDLLTFIENLDDTEDEGSELSGTLL